MYKSVSINPQQAVANTAQATQLGLQNRMLEQKANMQQAKDISGGIGQVANFLDRKEILDQLGNQQAQLGGQAPVAPQKVDEAGQSEILASGGIVDEESEARFSAVADKSIGQPKEVVDQVLVENIVTGEAQGKDMSDSKELLQLPEEQQQLAIGNINTMIKNKAVRRMMARDPKAANEFLKGLGVTGIDGASKVQFGAQQTIKDSEGNLFTITQKRNPSTGQVETAYAPIGDAPPTPVGKVEQTGAFGFTGAETIGFESNKARDKLRQGAIERGAQTTYDNVSKIDASISSLRASFYSALS